MMLLVVFITSCHVSENLKTGPVTAHRITMVMAVIKATTPPVTFVTPSEKLLKNLENLLCFFLPRFSVGFIF